MRQIHRTASIIAGIFTLLQALFYTIFSIYGCAIYTCMATFPFSIDANHKSYDLLYLAYFKGKCRAVAGEPQVEAESAVRTYYFLLAYGIVSAVWIPTSTLLVVASVSRVKGHRGALLFYPWIVNMIGIIILDLIGSVWYGLDIMKTLTAKEFLSFLGNDVGPVPANIDGITVAPAMVMVAIFSRAIVIWIINTIMLGVVIQAARDVKKTFSTSDFIKGSTPKSIQQQMKKEAETSLPVDEAEARWVRVTNSVILPRVEKVDPVLPEQPKQQAPQFPHDNAASFQSPIGMDAPSPLVTRRHSLRRTGSSPVHDYMGSPTGETFPFSQDPNRRYTVNDPEREEPSRSHDPTRYSRDQEALERERSREREQERETERQMAMRREWERERQDREFQRLRNVGNSVEGSPNQFRRRGVGDSQEDEMLNNQRPWQYVRPTDINLKPKYDITMKPKPRFAPEVAPKPSIPAPDYTGGPGKTKWDPTNLYRSNSNAAYPDQRWNPRRAY